MKKCLGLLYFFSFILIFKGNAQTDIYLKEYRTHFTPKRCVESTVQYLGDSSYIKIDLFSCKGRMNIKEFDRNGKMLTTGQYGASLDTLKEYVDVFDLFGDIKEVKVEKYFQPLKDGVWIYYENGEIKRKEKYRLGILLRE